MSDNVAIRVSGVSKSFKLPHENVSSIKGALIGFWKRNRGYETQHVLKDISFEIKKGEFFGIVGRNGSGKSTLLKLISQIYSPDEGHIQVNGKLTPFIELGVGFNPELTGRDNVYLNGALLGFDRKEMDAMYNEIVEFAELERFMDQKLKNYSSGMQVRLAFSIAIRANMDILVLDEVLAVGDDAFQKKCFDYFAKIKKDKKTVVLVTHDMNAVEKFCTRALLLSSGEIKTIGSPPKVAASYIMENVAARFKVGGSPVLDNGVKITDLRVLRAEKQDSRFKLDDTISVVIDYEASREQDVEIATSFRKADDTLLAGIGSRHELGVITLEKGRSSIVCDIPAVQFVKDNYQVNASIWNADNGRLLDYRDSTLGSTVPVIHIVDSMPSRSGVFSLNGTWHKPKKRAK